MSDLSPATTDRSPAPASLPGRIRDTGLGWVRSLAGSTKALPTATVGAVGDRLDQLVDRVVRHPSPVRTSEELAEALTALRENKNGAASAASFLASTSLASRTLRIGTKKMPLIAAATGAASALAVFATGFRELRMIASHLVHRAHAAGVVVDPGALRSVALQVYLRPGETPRLDEAPSLLTARLATRWSRTAAAEALPLVPDNLGRPKVAQWVTAASTVDPRVLASRPKA
ncbi:hypothetical protein [Actinomarinicola tropica]|uniref:Uncharacterized protein n=1 Tax=Actinomarinicola tropica TaxID=2789776 RepID=A0A5Q2RMZ3_9ACTN|nr:hypothetical protein [Actinomarinicola tropica]QGG96312.1 hypothetical protein GH723_15070 [Actinomarinicola tropica]